MKFIFKLCLIGIWSTSLAQNQSKKVLFIGNSYTYVNNLPQLIKDVSLSVGDTLVFDSSTPGGYTFQSHTTNSTTLSKIASGGWDYVVLQEQSQLPSFPISQVEVEVFPFAQRLDSLIHSSNPCAKTAFYMTWGRKNGDASNCPFLPILCTYTGMDSLLNLRYRMMAESNMAELAPVGAVWRYLQENRPSLNLYQSDESHPSLAGSYAAACTFYSLFFRKDPTLISVDAGLPASDAEAIRLAAKTIVYSDLERWHIGEYDPKADFGYSISESNTVYFSDNSTNKETQLWKFGDGNSSAELNPTHIYANPGTYEVSLIVGSCGFQDSLKKTISISPLANAETRQNTDSKLSIYPNPSSSTIKFDFHFIQSITYRLIDLRGVEVQTGVINPTEHKIDISSISTGIYILQLSENNQLVNQLLVFKEGN
jgi:hypothetical protein